MKADADDESMTPSRNDRRYTLRSVQSSPGRSFLELLDLRLHFASELCFSRDKVSSSKVTVVPKGRLAT